jgi:UDP-GlcNAc:undecaprenyl-phosphate/decaprenyl-phosphate GlcNAc-1-phosphate transferase
VSLVAATWPALPIIIGGFLLAALIAFLATPSIHAYVKRHRIMDHPDPRRIHDRPLPRGGGVSVVIAFVLVGGGIVLLGEMLPGMPDYRSIRPLHLVGLFAGAILATIIGALDDRFDLRARWQFVGQLAVAGVAVATGIVIDDVTDPFGTGNLEFVPAVGIAFTVVWIVGMINSLNFIDGLDGLSSGIALIAAVTLGLLSLSVGAAQPVVAILCFVLAGGLLGFLRWNFYPAVIFQGTAGVMFLGYVLGVLAILGSAKIIVALLVLAVPIIDTFWVIVRRMSSGRSPFTPDRGHIHHRLLDLGLSHGQTVLVIYAICVALALLSFLLSGTGQLYAFLGLALAFGLALFLFTRDETVDALEAETYEAMHPEPAQAGLTTAEPQDDRSA